MRTVLTVLALVALTFGSMPANASESSECANTGALNPPCGWINPKLSLELPTNVKCGTTAVLGVDPDPTDCMEVPMDGSPAVFPGEFLATWEISEEGTYANDPSDPIEVSFRGTGSNPSFLEMTMEPSSFTLDTVDLFNPQHLVVKERADGSNSVWFEYRQPVTVTISRDGEPTADDIERIQNKNGVVQFLIRIHSDGSGATYKDAYGLEAFYFHSRAADEDQELTSIPLPSDNPGKSTPAPSLAFLLAALASVVMLRRR